MIIIRCHDLTDYGHTRPSKIMLSVTQYALYILRMEQLHFSNNFNSLQQLKNRAVQGM